MTIADKLAEALRGLSNLYGFAWDRVDGGLMMMEAGVERFDIAHEKALAALAEYDANPGGWLPIETAPKDETWFLAIAKNGCQEIIRYDGDNPEGGRLWFDSHRCYRDRVFVGWQPLPPSPKESQP
jgi:hypothetical protein